MTSISGSASERRQLIALAVPLAAQQLGFQLMGSVDAAILGHYSEAALAGAGVGNNLLFGITSIGYGIIMGLDTVVPQAIGAGRGDDARRMLGAGLRLAVIVGLVGTLLVFATPVVLDLAGVQPDVAHEARPYLYVRALGVVPFLTTIALRSYLAAHHITRPLIIAVVAGNLANALLDLAFVFGVDALGIPPLGVIGAAFATSIVQIVILAIYALGVRALDAGVVRPRSTRADMFEIARYGGPVGAQIFAEVGIFGVATVISGHLGTLPAAAHGIALNVSSLTFSATMGIASAVSVRVGHAVGAGDLALARKRGLLGVQIGLVVMACFAAAFLLAPHAIASAFTDDPSVRVATVSLLYIAALFQLSDGTQAIAAGALRGLGRTQATLVANLVGHYVVGLPIMLALGFAAGRGIGGVWWGLSVGLSVTAAYLVWWFVRSTSRSRR